MSKKTYRLLVEHLAEVIYQIKICDSRFRAQSIEGAQVKAVLIALEDLKLLDLSKLEEKSPSDAT